MEDGEHDDNNPADCPDPGVGGNIFPDDAQGEAVQGADWERDILDHAGFGAGGVQYLSVVGGFLRQGPGDLLHGQFFVFGCNLSFDCKGVWYDHSDLPAGDQD